MHMTKTKSIRHLLTSVDVISPLSLYDVPLPYMTSTISSGDASIEINIFDT